MTIHGLKEALGKTDMYLIDLLQKGYFDKQLKVLDAGCGTGRNIWMFAQLGHKIDVCDQNEESIVRINQEIISRNLATDLVNARVAEIGDLPYSNNTFNFVICNAVLHFAKDQVHFKEMMKDLTRILKSRGVLFLRFVSSHTFGNIGSKFNQVMALPDGSNRFVVDEFWLKNELIPNLNLSYAEEFKTINVDHKRTMTTLVLRAK